MCYDLTWPTIAVEPWSMVKNWPLKILNKFKYTINLNKIKSLIMLGKCYYNWTMQKFYICQPLRLFFVPEIFFLFICMN